jgi:tripartite-type tricarboxylate transporter receptor subunit TctC
MQNLKTLTAALPLAALATVGLAQHAGAATDAEFFKKARMTIHIGFGAGGGYDAYARALARHMGRHIPGNPRFKVQNRPGAGSMRLTNELYNSLPQDGTAMGMISRGIPMEALFGNKSAKFEPTKFNWIGSLNNEVSTCVTWNSTGIDTLDKFLHNKVVVGATGPGADTTIFPKVLNNVGGGNIRLVVGYPSGTAANLAMERGEVQGRCGWSWSSLISIGSQWLRDKKINIVVQMSTSKHPGLTKMGVPWVMDLAKNERQRKILALVFARQAMGRPIVAPPGVPESRVKILRDAFDATMKDPKFLAETKDRNLEITPVPGTEVQALMTDIMSTSKDVVQAAKEATLKTTGMFITKAKVQFVTDTGAVSKVIKKGRSIALKLKDGKEVKAKISGSRTAITVGGKTVKRGAIKVGMTCSVTYPGAGQEAKKIECK